MTCGKSTTFGSGNSRARPLNWLKAAWSSFMMQALQKPGFSEKPRFSFLLRFDELRRIGPGVWRRVERDHRYEFGVNLQAPVRVSRREHLGEAVFHLPPKGRDIQPEIFLAIGFQVLSAGMKQLAGPADITVAEMVE